jgi:hypothetical protein
VTRATFTLAQTLILALWLGGALLFVAVVAPAAFAVLPTRTLAGSLVGRVLPALFIAGALVGIGVAMLEMGAPRRRMVTGRMAAGLVMLVSCGIAQFVIAPRIAALRLQIGGAIDALPLDDTRRAAFGRLHGLSVLWLGAAAIAALVALALAVHAQQRDHDRA